MLSGGTRRSRKMRRRWASTCSPAGCARQVRRRPGSSSPAPGLSGPARASPSRVLAHAASPVSARARAPAAPGGPSSRTSSSGTPSIIASQRAASPHVQHLEAGGPRPVTVSSHSSMLRTSSRAWMRASGERLCSSTVAAVEHEPGSSPRRRRIADRPVEERVQELGLQPAEHGAQEPGHLARALQHLGRRHLAAVHRPSRSVSSVWRMRPRRSSSTSWETSKRPGA